MGIINSISNYVLLASLLLARYTNWDVQFPKAEGILYPFWIRFALSLEHKSLVPLLLHVRIGRASRITWIEWKWSFSGAQTKADNVNPPVLKGGWKCSHILMGKILGKGGNNDDDVGGNVEGKGDERGNIRYSHFTTILNKKLSNSWQEWAPE